MHAARKRTRLRRICRPRSPFTPGSILVVPVDALTGRRPGWDRSAGTGLADGGPELVGVAGGKSASVHVDLVVDQFEVLAGLGQLCKDGVTVSFQQGDAFGFVAGSGADELCVAADGLDGHAGGAQFRAYLDPREAQACRFATCAAEARTRICPSLLSSAARATAVCDALRGSIPIITTPTMSSSKCLDRGGHV